MLKKRFALISIFLTACAPMTWMKPGASQNEFSTDKYECLQQAQQRVSGAQVNTYGGSSSNQVITNNSLFRSCMNSRGWYLGSNQKTDQSLQKLSSSFRQEIDAINKEYKTTCEREDVKVLFYKTKCNASEITLEQLSDKSKISVEEKKALSIYQEENKATTRKFVATHRKYGALKGEEIAAIREKFQQIIEKNQFDFYSGIITWGDFSRRRQEISIQLRDEFNKIAQH